MSKTIFAFGDVHGRLDLLEGLMSKIRHHIALNGIKDYEFVFLGDYVDRGPDSKGVIDYLMALEKSDTTHCLMGNHEDLMLKAKPPVREPGWKPTIDEWRQTEQNMYWWTINGGIQTLESYGAECGQVDPYTAYREVDQAHLDWMAALPTWYENDTHYFVHAGVNPHNPLETQHDHTRMWIREEWLQSEVDMGKHVVHGHTPKNIHGEYKAFRTNLDTQGYYSGVLTCGVFTPEQGGPIEVIQYKGKSA